VVPPCIATTVAERSRAAGDENAVHDDVERVARVALVEDDLARPEPPPYRHAQERGPLTIA
jgi:hypothetical protein